MRIPSIDRTWGLIAAGVLFCALGAIRAGAIGQDANWDQQNYHLYDAYGFLHGRLLLDVAPAGNQSYFNPLPYLPFYLLIETFPPRIAAMVLGALQASVCILILVIAREVAGSAAERSTRWAVFAALVISAASPVAISELGTSFADLMLSIPVLLALCVMLPVGPARRRARLLLFLAAASMGAGAGLKLTNTVFCIGLAAACVVGWRTTRERLVALLCTALGGMAGFLVADGFWALQLWQAFRNPVFPYYNNIFRSPDYPPVPLYDPEWIPKSIGDGLSYPFQWALGKRPSLELAFRDTRYLALILLTAAAAAIAVARRPGSPQADAVADDAGRARRRLAVFAAVSFPLWLFQFGYQRYLIPLELLLGPLSLCALAAIFGPKRQAGPALLLAAVAAVTMKAPDWGHVKWSGSWYALNVPAALQGDSLYFLGDPPLGYVAALFPPNARFLDLIAGFDMHADQDTSLVRRARGLLDADPAGTVRLITVEAISSRVRSTLGSYGLDLAGTCIAIPDHIRPLTVCDLIRGNKPARVLMPVAPDAHISFAESAASLPLLGDGWSGVEDWGSWAVGKDATILFRLGPEWADGAVAFRVDSQAFVNDRNPVSTVTVSTGTETLAQWEFSEARNRSVRTLCIPAAAVGPDRAVELRFHQDHPVSPAEVGLGADRRPLNIAVHSLDIAPVGASDCASVHSAPP